MKITLVPSASNCSTASKMSSVTLKLNMKEKTDRFASIVIKPSHPSLRLTTTQRNIIQVLQELNVIAAETYIKIFRPTQIMSEATDLQSAFRNTNVMNAMQNFPPAATSTDTSVKYTT